MGDVDVEAEERNAQLRGELERGVHLLLGGPERVEAPLIHGRSKVPKPKMSFPAQLNECQ